MKFTINLATRRYLNLRRIDAALALCLLVLVLLLILRVRETAYNQAELARLKTQIATAPRAHGAQVSEAQLKAQAGRVAFANSVIERKSMNWLGLLDRLEEVVPAGVAISGLHPDGKDPQKISMTGAARGFSNLRELLENMERSRNFSDVYLMNEAETKVGQTQQGITFSINCKVLY
ncbi:MAG TPA: PilN domain-containing protein [Geomonas sp.]|nr:PilN domain-containing protein [Geomonas sp.]